MIFTHNESVMEYNLEIVDKKVQKELLTVDGEKYIERDSSGEGQIKGEEKSDYINFKIPENQLCITRQDEIQHPKLLLFTEWANSVRFFKFTTDNSVKLIPDKNEDKEPNDNTLAINTFTKGKEKFKTKFVKSIIEDMNKIGYEIESIKTGEMKNIKVESPFPIKITGLLIKEKDCNTEINQIQLSDGMFRALSILIQFNYYRFNQSSSAIIIDDVGEGLDFNRASKLVKILVQNAKAMDIQLVMATNDKFIMNVIDLKHWHVVTRNGGDVEIRNIRNSKSAFEEFRFTGLNNFDFFSSDFLDNEKE
jgi:predicted ATPase